ncbi:MAG: PEP-CTERM sorting domain-containing protein [Methanoregulaceae archaeon]|nr:PEP-CTERM sorting domain-containing protein [Methanoregulaceae archaeon]
MHYKLVSIALGLTISGSAAAITFSNVTFQAPPLSDGATFNTSGNSISFFVPSAIVGDPVDPLRAGVLTIEYDVFTAAPAYAAQVGVNLGVALAGSGMVSFLEQVYEINSLGNEIGGPIGTASHTFNPGGATNWNGTITFDRQVERFRAKKFFELSAVDTVDFDLAAIGLVNQNVQVVPEPATLAALGIGVTALLRRKRKN